MLCNCTRNKPWFKKFKDDHIPLNETIDAISENEEFNMDNNKLEKFIKMQLHII